MLHDIVDTDIDNDVACVHCHRIVIHWITAMSYDKKFVTKDLEIFLFLPRIWIIN